MGDVIYFKKREEAKEKTILVDKAESELYDFFCDFVEGFKERGYDIIDITVAPVIPEV